MRGASSLAVGALALLALLAPTAAAHTDKIVADDRTLVVPAGGSESLAFSAHYHRLFGSFRAEGAPVVLSVVEESAFTAGFAGGAAPRPLWSLGPVSGTGTFNAAIDCCDDVTWAPFRLVIDSADASRGATVTLTAKATHDDLLVGMSGVEGGPLWTWAPFWGMTALLAYRLARAPAIPPPAGDVRRLALASVAVAGLAAALPIALARWGDAKFGGGALPGFVAAAGTLLPHFGPAVLFSATLLVWIASIVLWLRAFRIAAHDARAPRPPIVFAAAGHCVFALALPAVVVAGYGARVALISTLATLPVALVVGVATARMLRR